MSEEGEFETFELRHPGSCTGMYWRPNPNTKTKEKQEGTSHGATNHFAKKKKNVDLFFHFSSLSFSASLTRRRRLAPKRLHSRRESSPP